MDGPTLEANSLEELRKVEPEAVRRLNEVPSAAELFLIDPVGALASVKVVVSRETAAEWGRLVGGTLPSVPKVTRDLTARSKGQMKMKVVIRGILPPCRGPPPGVQPRR